MQKSRKITLDELKGLFGETLICSLHSFPDNTEILVKITGELRFNSNGTPIFPVTYYDNRLKNGSVDFEIVVGKYTAENFIEGYLPRDSDARETPKWKSLEGGTYVGKMAYFTKKANERNGVMTYPQFITVFDERKPVDVEGAFATKED